MRRLMSSFFSSAPFLLVNSPSTTILPFGTNRNVSIVTAGGSPVRAMIAAAGVDTKRLSRRPLRERIVHQPDIGLVQLILHTRGRIKLFLERRVAQGRKHRVVDLQIGAADAAQRPKFLFVNVDKIGPEILRPAINALVFSGAEPVQHAGRRNGQLRRRLGRGFQELKGRGQDRLAEAKLSDNLGQIYFVLDRTGLVVEWP